MKKLLIVFLLLFSFPIFAENLRHLPFDTLLTTIDKQCRNGNKTACNSLSGLYFSGNELVNISPNEKKAKEYNFITCQKFDEDCLSYYQDYVAKNYLKVCSDNANKKLNQMVSCVKLFREEKEKKQSSEITNYIEKQCQEKQFWACFSIFRYYENKEDKENLAKYDLLLEQSAIQKCEKESYPFICEMYDSVNKRRKKPKKYYDKWLKLSKHICDNKLPDIGNYSSCWLYARNTKTEKEEMQYYDKGCHLGDTQSCISLSALYFSKKDIKSGRDYFGKACDLGNIHGCIIYQNLGKKLDKQRQEQFKKYMKQIISFYFVD